MCFIFPIKQNVFLSIHLNNNTKSNLFNPYNLTIYFQLILCAITLLIRFYLKNFYYKRLRILGYNNHHDRVKKYVLFPSIVLHHSNALLLISTIIFYNLNLNNLHIKDFYIKPIHSVELIVSISSLFIIVNNVLHFYHELKFRRFRNPPDVFCVDDPSRRLNQDGLNQVAIRCSNIYTFTTLKLNSLIKFIYFFYMFMQIIFIS